MPFQQAQLSVAPLQAEKRRRNRLYKQRTSGKTYLPAVPSRDDGRTIKMKILAPCDKTSIGTCPLKHESEVARMLKTSAVRFGGKRAILPIEEAEIENSCGYIFKGSTNMMMYLEDYVAQMEASEGVMNVAQPVVPAATA